jgi:hypothetical protein
MEIFKDIKGYEGLYQVSNLGNVKSFNQNKNGKILTLSISHRGYVMVSLRINIQKSFSIHRLVAQAFIQNTENKSEVNHINGIKTDNRVENLEWATRSENQFHAYRTGLKKAIGKKGENNPRSMPVVQMKLDGAFVANYAGAKEAARHTGIRQSGISKCCNGVIKKSFGFKWQYKI